MIETIGWLGSFLLAICAIPEMLIAIQTGNSNLSWYFLSFWLGGEILALVYVILKSTKINLLPLLLNYMLNIICLCVIIYIKL